MNSLSSDSFFFLLRQIGSPTLLPMHALHGILNIEGGCCLHILYEVLWMKQCTWCNCQTDWLVFCLVSMILVMEMTFVPIVNDF